MSTFKELKSRAKSSLKGNYLSAFAACLISFCVAGISSAIGAYATGAHEIINFANSGAIVMDDYLAMGAVLISAIGVTASVIQIVYQVLIEGPLSVGFRKFFLENREGNTSVANVFYGFKHAYGNNMTIMFKALVKNILWLFVFVIPGIVKAFEYSIIPYILAENPEMSSKEVFAEAKRLMKGNKMRVLMLDLSFIGWLLVSILTVGIGAFIIAPYYHATRAEFYKEIMSK